MRSSSVNSSANNFFNIVVGTNRTGKTTFCLDYAQKYHKTYPKRKIYYFDPLGVVQPQPHFILISANEYPELFADKKGTGVINFVMQIKNALIIFDDVRIYTEDRIDLYKLLLIKRRSLGLDILSIYHGFTEVQKKVFAFVNTLYAFRVSENYESYKNRIPVVIPEKTIRGVSKLKSFNYIRCVIN